MPGMDVDAALQHLAGPAEALSQVGILVEKEERHGHRAGLAKADALGRRAFGEAVAQALTQALHVLQIVGFANALQGRQRGGHGRRLKPEGAGHRNGAGALARLVRAQQGRDRVAVGEALAPAGEIGLDAHRRPAAVAGDAKAGPHVVDHQQGAGLVAELAGAPGIGDLRHGLINEGVVLERRGENRGQVVAGLGHGGLQARHVVVFAGDLVGLVLGHQTGRAQIAPGMSAMIGALGDDDGLAPGLGAGGHQRHLGGVAAVLAEDRPVGVGDHRGQGFGQLYHQGGGAGHGVAQVQLADEGRVDGLVAIAHEVGAIGAHEIQILGPVRVPDPGAAGAGEELRIVVGEEPDRLVAIHPAGDHGLGAFAQGFVETIGPGHGLGLRRKGGLKIITGRRLTSPRRSSRRWRWRGSDCRRGRAWGS